MGVGALVTVGGGWPSHGLRLSLPVRIAAATRDRTESKKKKDKRAATLN